MRWFCADVPTQRPGLTVRFGRDGVVGIALSGFDIDLALMEAGPPPAVDDFPELMSEPLSRAELEWTLARGIRRATEILLPGPSLQAPERLPQEVAHGSLAWKDDHRVVTLWGTPEEIGAAMVNFWAVRPGGVLTRFLEW